MNPFLNICIAMASALLFFVLSYFIYTDVMLMMITDFIPFKKEIIYTVIIIETFVVFNFLLILKDHQII